MKREIYRVSAMIVDANGTFNDLSGYPKTFDSHHYNDDCDKAKQRATGEWYDVMGAFAKRADRQLQLAYLTRINDGLQILSQYIGKVADLPDPEPEPEPEPTEE